MFDSPEIRRSFSKVVENLDTAARFFGFLSFDAFSETIIENDSEKTQKTKVADDILRLAELIQQQRHDAQNEMLELFKSLR